MKWPRALLLFLAAPMVAMGHDGPARRAETAPELRRARFEARLCPAEMAALVEFQRFQANQQILASYNAGLWRRGVIPATPRRPR